MVIEFVDRNWRSIFLHLTILLLYMVCVGGSDEDEGYCPIGRCLDGRCLRHEEERCLEDSCPYGRRRCDDTLLCVIWGTSCPGDPCSSSQQLCADGSCIPLYDEQCPDGSEPCNSYERRCDNGKCLSHILRCDEDACPESSPYRCGSKCIPDHLVCNGDADCHNGADEWDCEEDKKRSEKRQGNNLLWLLVLLIIPLGCCAWCSYYCCKDDDEKEKTAANDDLANDEEAADLKPGRTFATDQDCVSSQPINQNSTQNHPHQPIISATAVIENGPMGMHVTYRPVPNQNQAIPPLVGEPPDDIAPPPSYNVTFPQKA